MFCSHWSAPFFKGPARGLGAQSLAAMHPPLPQTPERPNPLPVHIPGAPGNARMAGLSRTNLRRLADCIDRAARFANVVDELATEVLDGESGNSTLQLLREQNNQCNYTLGEADDICTQLLNAIIDEDVEAAPATQEPPIVAPRLPAFAALTPEYERAPPHRHLGDTPMTPIDICEFLLMVDSDDDVEEHAPTQPYPDTTTILFADV